MNTKNNTFLQILNPDNTMSFNRLLAHAIGANETIIYFCLISKMLYFDNRGWLDEQGYFYTTAIDIQESTTFTQRQQCPAIKKLTEIGLIETKLKGIPSKKYYHIIDDTELILKLVEQGKNIADNIKQQAKSNGRARFDKMSKLSKSEENSQVRQNVEPRNDIMSNQASTNCQANDEQNVDTSIDILSMKAKYNNLNFNNLNINNQSINQSTVDNSINDGLIDCNQAEEERYRELIKRSINYDYLLLPEFHNNKSTIDEILEIMVEMVVYNKNPVKINGNMFPAEIVKSRFLKLNNSHIEYVYDSYTKNFSGIHNIKAYLITMLFNSFTTIDHYYQQLVKHDMYGF